MDVMQELSESITKYDRLSTSTWMARAMLELCTKTLDGIEEDKVIMDKMERVLPHHLLETLRNCVLGAQELLAHGAGETFLIESTTEGGVL